MMIAPAGYGDAVHNLRFLVAPVTVNGARKQLTLAEVVVVSRTTDEFVMGFPLLGGGPVADAALVAQALGGVGTVMEAWLPRAEGTPETTYAQVSEETEGSAELAAIGGFARTVRVRVPRGPCIVCAGWLHDLTTECLVAPTFNDGMPAWRADVVVVNGDPGGYGTPPRAPVAQVMRWDLMAAHGVVLDQVTRCSLVRQHNDSLPFNNLWFPLQRRDLASREYMGISGARLADRTALRLVSFCDVGMQTVPVVCGCFVRDTVNFAQAHVPMVIPERISRTRGTVEFHDHPEGVEMRLGPTATSPATSYVVGTAARQSFGGLQWVDVRRA